MGSYLSTNDEEEGGQSSSALAVYHSTAGFHPQDCHDVESLVIDTPTPLDRECHRHASSTSHQATPQHSPSLLANNIRREPHLAYTGSALRMEPSLRASARRHSSITSANQDQPTTSPRTPLTSGHTVTTPCDFITPRSTSVLQLVTLRRGSFLNGGRRHSLEPGQVPYDAPPKLSAAHIPKSGSHTRIMPMLPPLDRRSRNMRNSTSASGSADNSVSSISSRTSASLEPCASAPVLDEAYAVTSALPSVSALNMTGPAANMLLIHSNTQQQQAVQQQHNLTIVIPPPLPVISIEWGDEPSLEDTQSLSASHKPQLSSKPLDSAIADVTTSNLAFHDMTAPRNPLTTKILLPPPIPQRRVSAAPLSAIPVNPPKGTMPRAGTANVGSKKITKFNSCTSLFLQTTLVAGDLHETLRSASILFVRLINQTNEHLVTDEILSEVQHPLSRHLQFYLRLPSEEDIFKFLECIFHAAELTVECAIITVIYVERLLSMTGVTLHTTNWARTVLGGLILASKVWDDHAVWNVDFCQIFPDVDIRDLNNLERYYLASLEFNVNVKASTYAATYFDLRTIAEEGGRTFPLKSLSLNDVIMRRLDAAIAGVATETDTISTTSASMSRIGADYTGNVMNPIMGRQVAGNGRVIYKRSTSEYFFHSSIPASVI
ncbi:hypothetical protein SeLEV6574_g06715 [Synchytrium endobioticum]|uniref:Cyclin-like domain-containing protein n=1 Tax=Synchytrium endobioticum TaxID=286115 RepID=A0A507CKB9_9FUNG|nr:hypothetical protein SeLEV6574_g06715 [Synchytrium endobioticum]